MYRRDSDAVVGGDIANPMPFRHRHIGHILRQRERRNLDGIVTRVGDKLDGVVNRPTLENLIANGKLHFSDALKGTQMNTTRVTFQSNSKCSNYINTQCRINKK